ncbi:MAG: hypothetical protein FJX59_11195 [Alphaproteobacteria bacterium]|nr:hypothetical protein [Alphaproteobacteria bacterium]
MSNVTKLDHAAVEIEQIRAVLAAAKTLTEENRPVDLAAIARRLGALCTAVDAMPRDIGQALTPALESLALDLDGLAEVLNQRFGDLPLLGELANTKDAAGAYGTASKHFP